MIMSHFQYKDRNMNFDNRKILNTIKYKYL